MRSRIPAHTIGLLAEILVETETHGTLDTLFMQAGAPGDPPGGTKPAKIRQWLQLTNADPSVEPLEILGRILEPVMEYHPTERFPAEGCELRKRRVEEDLRRARLQYCAGGKVAPRPRLDSPTQTLGELIRDLDVAAVNTEFERALINATVSPREAVSAACNILESICKVIIDKDGLPPPTSLDLSGVFGVVRKHLGLDPASLEDNDLKAILSGLIAIAKGIGALRTHASSAHGGGPRSYALQPRHARLAIHSAHTLASFLLETWSARREGGPAGS